MRLNAIAALMRASLLTAMQYRADFLFDSLTGLIRTFAVIAPLGLVYYHTPEVQGWTLEDAALVMSLYLLMEALVGGLIQPNLGMVVEAIRTGTLDLVLMKPADAQLLVSLRTIAPARIWDLLASLGIGAWALTRVDTPSALDIGIAIMLLGCGLISVYAVWLLAICTSFFFVRVDNLQFLLSSVTDAGRWPVTVFSGWVRWVLTMLIPIALITSFPAIAIRGLWNAQLIGIAVVVATVFGVGSRIAWTRSLASYTSASS